MSDAHVAMSTCANCGTELHGPYCAVCGQKATVLNPTVHNFLHDLTHELLHVDGKIFQSVRLLLFRPGFLSREHFEGRRARYISPIRLYLIFSVAYFAVGALVPQSPGRITFRADSAAEEEAALRKLGFSSEEELQRAAADAWTRWVPRAMFVLVPFFAWLVHLAVRRSGRNYPQQLYFALHVHAVWFLAGVVGLLAQYVRPPWLQGAIVFVAVGYGLAYLVLALKRAYGMKTGRAVARAALVTLGYGVAVILAILGIVLPVVFGRSRGGP